MPIYVNSEYDIEKAFRAVEDELIHSMIRNLKGHRAEETKEGFNWSAWQTEQLNRGKPFGLCFSKPVRALLWQFRSVSDEISMLDTKTLL